MQRIEFDKTVTDGDETYHSRFSYDLKDEVAKAFVDRGDARYVGEKPPAVAKVAKSKKAATDMTPPTAPVVEVPPPQPEAPKPA